MTDITFVTVGKLKGKTINLGPDGKYRFVNGEMRVPDDQAGLVATALRFYCAFPKGDADVYHKALCAKAGIDPETLQPLGATPAPAPEPVPEPTPEPEPVVVEVPDPEPVVEAKPITREELKAAAAEVVDGLDPHDDEQWTQQGLPSVHWVRSQLTPELALLADRALLDEFSVFRPDV